MKFVHVWQEIEKIKEREGGLISNFVLTQISKDEEVEALLDEKGVVFVVQEPNRKKVYYAVSEASVLKLLLSRLESGVVLECIHRNENEVDMEESFLDAGFTFYKRYVRTSVCYCKNPYEIPEKGRRKILQEMYDPDCGEYPVMEDAEKLYELTRKVFDPLTDDVFTMEQWIDIIQKKECLVYRDAGEIMAYYVWRLEGKKLYSNITVNLGPANYLYNMERRIFETMWDKGIRVYYAWVDMKNRKALKRFNENADEYIKNYTRLFNSIYIKK